MRRTPEQWSALLQAQQRSGLSIAAFCLEQGIRAKSIYYWRQKLAVAANPPSAFIRAAMPLKSAPVSPCTLRYGAAKLVLGEVSPAWLAELMRALA